MMNVRKAVIPVAGFGTRFLPVTKAVPKALLPVLDTPVIHLAVEEAAAASIEHVIMVVSPNQEAIGTYFDESTDLERMLERQGRSSLLEWLPHFSDAVEITYVKQREPLGNGHAVLVAKQAVGNEPLAVILPDDVIRGGDSTIGRMIEIYGETGGPVIGVAETPEETIPQKGVVAPTSRRTAGYMRYRASSRNRPLRRPRRIWQSLGGTCFHRRSSQRWSARDPAREAKSGWPTGSRRYSKHTGGRRTVSPESCSTQASRQGC